MYIHIIYNNNYNSNPLHIISRQENIKYYLTLTKRQSTTLSIMIVIKTFTFDCRSFPHLLFLSGKIAVDLWLQSFSFLSLSVSRLKFMAGRSFS